MKTKLKYDDHLNCKSSYIVNPFPFKCIRYAQNKKKYWKKSLTFWPRRDLNTQPSDLESDALPLRHGVR